jgi:DNA polymerase-3 subunit gamma/tau
MYQVIARKYRPQRFSDVVGQEHVTQTLANAIAQMRIAHAYLFAGPRGTGKTTIARIFAKCLNCTGGPKVDFPDDDPPCLEISQGRSLDVIEIDGASNRGIDEIRELRDTVKYAPASSRFKVYIVDEVHMLTKEAFNALLKTLEEPPPHVKFMFATTEAEKVLPTILSRCQRFDLRRIPSALIVKHLAHVARQEKVAINEPALYAIARGADGGMRDAESTLDQLISYCGERIEESDVLSMFGLTAQSQIIALASAVIDGDAASTLRALDDLAKHGKDLGRLLSDLLGHFRNVMIYQVSGGDLSLLEISESEGAALSEESALSNVGSLTRIIDILAECESRMRDAASRRILIEVALLKAIDARNAIGIDAVISRLQELRPESTSPDPAVKSGTAGRAAENPSAPAAPAARVDSATPPQKAAAAPPTPVPAGDGPSVASTAELEELWNRVIDAVGHASPFTRSYLLEAHPVSFSQHVLTIGFDPEFADHLELVNNAKNRTLIQTKLGELGFAAAQVRFIQAEAPAGKATRPPGNTAGGPPADPPGATPAPAPQETPARPTPKSTKSQPMSVTADEFKNDPLIQKALEVFKGQIVDVRA